MKKIISLFLFLSLFFLHSISIATTTKVFSTTFDNLSGLEYAGDVTIVTYAWDASDDGNSKKICFNCSTSPVESSVMVNDTNRVYFYNIQTAQVLFKAPDGIDNHMVITNQWKTPRDGIGITLTGYFAAFGRDVRCGSVENIYLSTEKSYFGTSTNSQCDPPDEHGVTTCLFDCKLITFDPTKVYLLKITSIFLPYSRIEVTSELFTITGYTATFVAKSQYIDYYGGDEGDPITGERAGFLSLEPTKKVYFDKFVFRAENSNNPLDLHSNVEFINLAGIHADNVGYAFGTWEGNYLYLAPAYKTTISKNGRMARYDRSKRFNNSSGWEIYDVEANVDSTMVGYHGATSDGTYIYYAPLWSASWIGDSVARYNTGGSFSSEGSWSHFHLTDIAGLTDSNGNIAKGYVGAVKAGNYIYFVPYGIWYTGSDPPGSQNHGLVVRYDTTCGAGFLDTSCWSGYNISNLNGSDNLRGYHLGCYDGKYVYMAPFSNEGYHGRAVRHDSTKALNDVSGWSYFDLTSKSSSAKAFYGCTVAGDYVYFPTNIYNITARFTRYSRAPGSLSEPVYTDFTNAANWTVQNVTAVSNFPASGKVGYAGTDYINGYVYFAPDIDSVNNYSHGWMARHDITQALSTGWEFINLQDTNSNLEGHHGVVIDPRTGDLYFIKDRHYSGGVPIYGGYMSRHVLKNLPNKKTVSSNKTLLNAGFLFPEEVSNFVASYIDTFKQCGMINILPMGFIWPEEGTNGYMDVLYTNCIAKGLNFHAQPSDLGGLKQSLGIPGWVSRVLLEIPEIATAYPLMAGWFGGFDLEVTTAFSSSMQAGISTNDTYLQNLNSVLNGMISNKSAPIIFEAFNSASDPDQYKVLLKTFLLNMDARSNIIVNVYVADANSLPLVIKHVEACLEAGANYGIMLGYASYPPTLSEYINELDSLGSYTGLIRTYPDRLNNIILLLPDYLNYVMYGVY